MEFMMLAAAGHVAPAVAPWITYLFTGLLVAMVLCLALEEKIHAQKSVIVGVTAVIALLLGAFTGILPFDSSAVHLPNGHEIRLPVFIPGIEWGVITIILGSSLFVDVTSKSGLFTYIAIRLTKASRGDPRRLLWFYGVMTVVFSAVLNNVTAMIIVGSLSAVSLGKLGQRDKLLSFLLVEGLLTNIGGLLTLISSVPNIIVGQTAGISFIDFFLVFIFIIVFIFVIFIFFLSTNFLFHKNFDITKLCKVSIFDTNFKITRLLFYFNL